jgi:hypothetical protein
VKLFESEIVLSEFDKDISEYQFLWKEDKNKYQYSPLVLEKIASNEDSEVANSNFVFRSIRSSLEYLDDDGKELSFTISEHVSNIKSGAKMEPSTFSLEGNVSSRFTINCAPIVNPNGSTLYIQKDLSKRNFSKDEFYSSLTMVFKDSFTESDEYWKITVQAYCFFYELKVVIPKTSQVCSTQLYHHRFKKIELRKAAEQKLTPKNLGKLKKVDDAKYMLIEHYYSTEIRMQLTNVSNLDLYMLTWRLDKGT